MATPALRLSRANAVAFVGHSPGAVPCAVTCVVLLWFAGDEGGFRGTTWMPALLLLGAVLLVCLATLPRPQPSRAVRAAVLLLVGYGAWSLLSMLWADQQELAWDSGNRTLLYALIFALCALWPMRGQVAAAILGAFGLAIAGIALIELLKASGAAEAVQYFNEARFAEPVGYANANVALWMLGLFPCAILAARRGVPAPLRGLFLGAAVLLAGVSLLGQSRGWLIALPVTAVIAIVAVPGRGRTIFGLVAVGAGLAVALGPLLDVYSDWRPFQPPGEPFDEALRTLLIASAAFAVLGTLAALADGRVRLSEGSARRISGGVVAAVALVLAAGVIGYAVVERSPITATTDAWNEFKEGGNSPEDRSGRLAAGFSTYRYDYWRVAVDEFKRAPVLGAGADNFGRSYQVEGESVQTPRYPHSTPLVALAETGLIGTLLLFGAFGAALFGTLPALRRADLGGAAAGTGVVMFGYWLVHGSLDWFWEFPGLAGAALAGLGIAVAVARGVEPQPADGQPLLARRRALALAGAGALLLVASVTPPWLAEREQRRATEIAAVNPQAAVDRLERAARLNPLSPVPDKAAGIIEIRRGRYARAERELRQAFERDPGDSGLHLLLGVVASARGRDAEARRLVLEANQLAPRDQVTIGAIQELNDSGRLDPREVDEWIREDVRQRIGPD
ncbi:MAG: hypothetical protein QOH58_153 [Thermoleophilaceae bacterium]|nr:hypothetical protein [Thermoleophilaceae bacterium]